jgi:hypothetical protein
MSAFAITFADSTFARADAHNRFDLALGVEATLALTVGGRLIYTEPMFPIVELRQALSAWMPHTGENFEFTSMESDEPGLIWIRRQPSGLWRAGSIHQDDIATQELDTAEVVHGCADFVGRVDGWVRNELGVEVKNVLGGD